MKRYGSGLRNFWYLLLLLYGLTAPVPVQSNGVCVMSRYNYRNLAIPDHSKGWAYENTVVLNSWQIGKRRKRKPFLHQGTITRRTRTGIARIRNTKGAAFKITAGIFGLWMMTGANGDTLPGLNVEWAFRKSEECELILAASVVFQLMNQLVNASLGGPWPGQFRDIYNNAGRAMRLCDGVQHRCMEAQATKGICQH